MVLLPFFFGRLAFRILHFPSPPPPKKEHLMMIAGYDKRVKDIQLI